MRHDQPIGLAQAGNLALQLAFEQRADFIAWMEPEAICASERFETQLSFFKQNPHVDIVGSNMLVFNDSLGLNSIATGKVISFPTLDKLIKFNMLFTNSLAFSSVVVRVSSTGEKMSFNTEDPTCLAFEDYELWLRLIHDSRPPVFANIGSILIYLRKASGKLSSAPIEAEVPLKVNFLTSHFITGNMKELLKLNPQITEEFIKVTGRSTRSDTFSNLKQKKELNVIYQQVIYKYQSKLNKSLQIRKDESKDESKEEEKKEDEEVEEQ